MGFFKRKVKENEKSIYEVQPKYAEQYKEQNYVLRSVTPEGYLQVELVESRSHPQQGRFYDTTRVIIDSKNPEWINGKPIQRCKVSHYNQDDCQIIDGGEGSCSRTCYREVLAEFNISRVMQGDAAYTSRLLSALFDQKRIEKYLDNYALIPCPYDKNGNLVQCGNYIGELLDDGRKRFDTSIGAQVHNTPQYKALREKHFEDMRRKEKINSYYKEIHRLQDGGSLDDDDCR